MKVTVFNMPTTGHVDPSLSLVAELVTRGHHVDYFLTLGYQEQVEATGATYWETPIITDSYFDEVSRQFNPLRLTTQLLSTTYELLPHLTRQLAEIDPAVIIYDSMCPWGNLSARLAGVPAVASMSLLELPPSYLLKSGQIGTALKLVPRFLPWLRPYRQALRRLQEKYPYKLPNFPDILNWPGDLNISYTSAQINPESKLLGSSHIFVGPPLPTDASGIEFSFVELDSERPLIYISLGTVFNNNPTFFRECIEAFSESNYQVVMSLGKRLSPAMLGDIPPNFIVRPYVPQIEILQQASLFITHGGANSVHQALCFGLPLLLVPQQLEQALVAARMAELGVGLVLRQPAASDLQSTAGRLLGDSAFRIRAADLGAGLKSAGGVIKAADEIEALLK